MLLTDAWAVCCFNSHFLAVNSSAYYLVIKDSFRKISVVNDIFYF